jgi:hypothetical protein
MKSYKYATAAAAAVPGPDGAVTQSLGACAYLHNLTRFLTAVSPSPRSL